MTTARDPLDAKRPDEPRAPTTAVWRALGEVERRAVVAALGPMPRESLPPVGDPHINAERVVEDALDGWFRRRQTKAYIGRGITVYYPDEPRFEPDLFVVFDVEPGERISWIVDREGRGLDFVLEILFAGDRKKDMVQNVVRYARLGVPEYFVYDVKLGDIRGWRLEAGRTEYTPIVGQHGRWRSETLELELGLLDGKLRFYAASALLQLTHEVNAALGQALDAAEARARQAQEEVAEEARLRAEEARLRAEEARLRAEEARMRAEAEAEVARLRAELARLKGE
jgi:Uma2 family endonuclease